MEMKYVIILIVATCVVFIAVEEVFQSRSNSSLWNKPKLCIVPSTPDKVEDLLKSNKKILSPESNIKSLVDYKPKEQEEQDSRQKQWLSKVHGKFTRTERRLSGMITETGSISESMKGFHSKKLRRKKLPFWKKDGSEYLSEEEKLRVSPYIYHEEDEIKSLSPPLEEKEIKYISYFLPYELEKHQPHSFEYCRYKKCAFVDDMTQADLVAFSAGNIRDHEIRTFKRPQGQRWLMYTIDPAIKKGYNFDGDNIKSLFNATCTYNLDADIPYLFGRLKKQSSRPITYYDQIFERKTKMAAWFVSHCVTLGRREVYVERMNSLLDVDIYGQCGNLSCGGTNPSLLRSHDASVCLPMLTYTYKFYIAFENSFCLDYVTEKFFKLFQDVQAIPVVRGGFQYKKYLPSGIFVNADDFETPEELAQYLIDLGNDKQRYTEMLRRKDEWKLVKLPPRDCLLCEYLHSNPPNKFYTNLKEKFGRGSCWFPKKLN